MADKRKGDNFIERRGGTERATRALTEIALRHRNTTRLDVNPDDRAAAEAMAHTQSTMHQYTSTRRIQTAGIYLWRQGAGQRASILNTYLGIDAGLDTLLRQQAEIPLFDEISVDGDSSEVNPIWAKAGPTLSSHTFASRVVQSMMPGWRTRKGSAVCNIETAEAATRNACDAVWPSAPDEIVEYAVSLVLLFGTTLGLIMDPESETALTEERGRAEPVTLAEVDTAIMYSATARAAFAALSTAIPETDEYLAKEIVANALQAMIDAFIRSRPNYVNYMSAIRRHLGALRLALASGMELNYADSSEAYRMMSSNLTFLRIAQRTKGLPIPSLELDQRWLTDAILCDEALTAIEEEFILLPVDKYVRMYNVATDPRQDLSLFGISAAGGDDQYQIVKSYPRGGSRVLNIREDSTLQDGLDCIQGMLNPFVDIKSAMDESARYTARFASRPGATEINAIGIESEVMLSLARQPNFTALHVVNGGLRKVRPDYGVSEVALTMYMERDLVLAPVVNNNGAMDQSVFSHSIGAEVSTDSTTTFSPWAVVRLMEHNIGQDPTDPEQHLGRMLSQHRAGRLIAYSGTAVARQRLYPYEKFTYQLTISHPDRLVFSKKRISLVRFLVGSAVYYEDERVYLIGPQRRTQQAWMAGQLRVMDAWDAIATGNKNTMWSKDFGKPWKAMLSSNNMHHQATELVRKLSPHATRYNASRSGMQALTTGSRASSLHIGLTLLGYDDLATDMYELLIHPALQRDPDVAISATEKQSNS